MNVKLCVSNIPKYMTQGEIPALFIQVGDVIEADLITDRKNGETKGFAFVTMNSRSGAEKVIHMFNKYTLNEQKIKVKMAKPSFQL